MAPDEARCTHSLTHTPSPPPFPAPFVLRAESGEPGSTSVGTPRGASSTLMTVAALRGTRASPAVAAAAASSPYAIAPGAHTQSQLRPQRQSGGSPPRQPRQPRQPRPRRRGGKPPQGNGLRPVSGGGASAARHLAAGPRGPGAQPRSAAGVRDTTLHAEANMPPRPRSRRTGGDSGGRGAYSPVGMMGARFSRAVRGRGR